MALSQDDIARLTQKLTDGDRGGFYWEYYKLTGEYQAMIQGQITTYSGTWGGMAMTGNYLAKLSDQKNYSLTLDQFSTAIIAGTLEAIESDGDGILDKHQMQFSDYSTWDRLGMGELFPGNMQFAMSVEGWLFHGDKIFTEGTENSLWMGSQSIDIFSSEDYKPEELGNRFDEFQGAQYDKIDLTGHPESDGRFLRVVDTQTGHLVFIQDTQPPEPFSSWIQTNLPLPMPPVLPGVGITWGPEDYRAALSPGSPAYIARELLKSYVQADQASGTEFIPNQVPPNVFFTHELNNGLRIETNELWHQEILNKIQALDLDSALDFGAREGLMSLYSREDNRGVEAFLISMERRFLGHDNPQPVLDQQGYVNRVAALATYLDSLEGEGDIAQIVDLSMYSSSNILDVASQPDRLGMAYRYSLLHLDPLALVGDEGLYTKHNQEGELELESFSSHYLADRAAMLAWLIIQGQLPDSQQVTDYAAKDGQYYKDSASGQEVTVLPDPRDAFLPDVHRVFFGSDGADILEGNKGNDRLYGGASNDILKGEAGNDYLEGGSGNDQLDGGADNDTLLGGSGDDVLIGGTGNDVLDGGVGKDTYRFEGNFGYDTIQDSGGQGSIVVDGTPLTGGEKVAEDVYRDTTTGWTYTRADNDLLLHKGSDAIRIVDWTPGSLGITLDDEVAEPAADNTITGDFIKQVDGTVYVTSDTGYASAGAQADTDDVLLGGSGADSIVAGGGNDGVLGGAGDDLIDGGAGDDLLMGGQGADRIAGGDGVDYIFGSVGGYLERPGESGFSPVRASGPEVTRGFNWVVYQGTESQTVQGYGSSLLTTVSDDEGNFIAGGSGDDHIDSGTGNDTVHGNQDDDAIFGMAGNDVLFGDEGNDTVYGDGVRIGKFFSYTPLERDGHDLLLGGEGDDFLVGQGGRDSVFGGAGEDKLFGDERWDESSGATPASLLNSDYLDGGDDDDYLEGGGGDDVLIGGTGNDNLWGDASTSFLGGAGHGRDTLDGGAGNDTLWGGGDEDLLRGGEGADFLHGDDNDLPGIYHGDDRLEGGDGDDGLWGDGGNDVLIGGAGNDWLAGEDQTSSSVISSTLAGDDYLDGGDGNDVLIGGNGNDTLLGGTGDDRLLGGDGDDLLIGGSGSDTLLGGLGNDRYIIEKGGLGPDLMAVVQDVGGNDTLVVNTELTASSQLFNQGDLVLSLGSPGEARSIRIEGALRGSIEQIQVGLEAAVSFKEWVAKNVSHSLTLTSSKAGETLFTGIGADVLSVSHSGVTVEAGRGNDTINLDGGTNSGIVSIFNVGDGRDVISGTITSASLASRQANIARFGEGVERSSLQLVATRGTSTAASLYVRYGSAGDMLKITLASSTAGATLRPFDLFEFADGSALTWEELAGRGVIYDASVTSSIAAIGTLLDDQITGSGSADTIKGGDGDDVIDGGAGNDNLSGNNGADIYIFGKESGSDTITNADSDSLGTRSDTIRLQAGVGTDEVIFERSGNNLIIKINGTADRLTVSNYFSADATTSNAIEFIVFEDGTQLDINAVKQRVLIPTSGNDTITGYATDNNLAGGDGNDRLSGEAGNDLLDGGAGADTLIGGSGLDTLIGGAGNDSLNGGLGNDVYRFAKGFGTDTLNAYDTLSSKYDSIEFLDIDSGDISVSRSFGDLLLTVLDTEDTLLVSNFFDQDGNGASRIDEIKFSDGTSWAVSDVLIRVLASTLGNDTLTGYSTDDYLSGEEGDDQLVGWAGNDTLLGGSGNDTLSGNDGQDLLVGGTGNDYLEGGKGNDTYRFSRGFGQDTVNAWESTVAKNDVIEFFDISSTDVTVSRVGSSLVLSVEETSDSLSVNDYFYSETDQQYKVQTIVFADGVTWSAQDIALASLIATDGNDRLYGFDADELIDGGSESDYIDGGAGNDSLVGSSGNDSLYGGLGDDTLEGGVGNDFLNGGLGNDTYCFAQGFGSDTISSNDGTAAKNDTVLFSDITAAEITISRRSDDLLLSSASSGDSLLIIGYFAADATTLRKIELIRFSDGVAWSVDDVKRLSLIGTSDNDHLYGFATDDTLSGGQGSDEIEGLSGNDLLLGDAGNDTISGNNGNDTIVGGTGDDVLSGGYDNNVYRFERGDGVDLISGDYGDASIIEFGASIKPDDVIITRLGYSPQDSLRLTIRSESGALLNQVTLYNYFKGANEISRISYSDGTQWDRDYILKRLLTGSSEADAITGYATDDSIAGGAGSDRLRGVAGNDYIDGGIGVDWVYGGDGDDTLLGGEGNDFVLGDSGTDLLSGGGGDDLLQGGLGSDTYSIELGDGDDTISEEYDGTTGDTDVVSYGAGIALADLSFHRMYDSMNGQHLVIHNAKDSSELAISNFFMSNARRVELLQFSGGSSVGVDYILNNLQYGEQDTMLGSSDDDSYIVDNELDVIVEPDGSSIDTVYSSRTFTLSKNLENLTLTGFLDLDGTGSELDNFIVGNSGDNILRGKDGNDTGVGGLGDDIYYDFESVIEQQDGGIDTWYGFSGGQLPDNVEIGYLGNGTGIYIAQAIGLVGNDLDNVLYTRNNGIQNDTLDGGLGADTMTALGWDSAVYFVDNPGDLVVASSSGGRSDEVRSTIDYQLGDYVENLILIGNQAATGIGNNLNNIIDSRPSAVGNILAGGLGNDSLYGGMGDDSLDGGAGNDELRGGQGNDYLIGGAGSDTYYFALGDGQDSIDNYDTSSGKVDAIEFAADIAPGDIVITRSITSLVLSLHGSTDKVTVSNYFASDDASTSKLEEIRFADGTTWDFDQVETLLLQSIVGTDGNDTLNGGMGTDTLYGGTGDDVYVMDDPADAIIEYAGEGIDRVNSSISWTLGVNLENLTLTGSDAIDGRGNGLDNVLHGNDANNVLDGSDGNDSLHGGEGNDTLLGGAGDDLLEGGAGDNRLEGGAGNDQYRLAAGWGNDRILDSAGSDSVHFVDVKPADLLLHRDNADLLAVNRITGDQLRVVGQFAYQADAVGATPVEFFVFADGTSWDYQAIKLKALEGTAQDDTIYGHPDNDLIEAGAGNDTVHGQNGADEVHGGDGNDNLNGGVGNDQLFGGTGDDKYVYKLGDGVDTIDNTGGGNDGVFFSGGIDEERLTFTRDGDDLLILVDGDAEQSVRVLGHFLGGDKAISYVQPDGGFLINATRIAQIVAAGNVPGGFDTLVEGTAAGEQLAGGQERDLVRGLAGNDTLFGMGGNDQIEGGDGNDYLSGGNGSQSGSGDDILIGGIGNDVLDGEDGDDQLTGGAGDDKYYYRANGGVDVIDNSGGGFDGAFFIGIARTRLSFHREGDDLLILVDGDLQQQVKVTKHFLGGDFSIDYVQPDGGSYITTAQIAGLLTALPDGGTGEPGDGGNPGDGEEPGDGGSNPGGGDQPPVVGVGGDDVLTGTAANEVLMGGAGNDTLNGGAGNDRLLGGIGDDAYVYTAGQDVLEELGGNDTLNFANGITFNQVASGLGKSGNDLVLKISGSSANQVTLKDFFLGGDNLVETISFETGGQLTAAQIFGAFGIAMPTAPAAAFDNAVQGTGGDDAALDGTAQRDLLQGFNGNDLLSGAAGNDRLEGGNGNDSLHGGAGNDTLAGGRGDDTYVFAAGGGQDVIDNSGGGFDTLRFEGITFNQVSSGLMKSGNDLLLKVSGGSDQVTLKNWFLGGDHVVDVISFAAGGQLTAAQLFGAFGLSNPDPAGSPNYQNLPDERAFGTILAGQAGEQNIIGSSDADLIDGGAGNDKLRGGKGNDYLLGGDGSDTYYFAAGDGQDSINNLSNAPADNDVLSIEGITRDNLWLSREGDRLVIDVTGSTDSVTVQDWYANSAQRLDAIQAGGSTLYANQVDNLVSAMAAFGAPAGGEINLSPVQRDQLNTVIAANWQ